MVYTQIIQRFKRLNVHSVYFTMQNVMASSAQMAHVRTSTTSVMAITTATTTATRPAVMLKIVRFIL